MNYQQADKLAKLTENILKRGLDYRVTLSSTVKVELLEMKTGLVLAEKTGQTVEDVLESLLDRVYQ